MKHRFFNSLFTVMVGALAFTSCSNEVVDNTLATGKKQMTFTASYDKNISSRTTLGDDLSVLWADGDVISVLDGTNNNDFTLSSGAGSSTAEFNGAASAASTYYAVYPYQSKASVNGNVISNVVIPATQTATLGSFDPNANVMTAVSSSANNLAFKHVCSYAKITTTAACKKIVFTAGAEDKIAGTFKMTVGNDGISSAAATSDVNSVTLVPSTDCTIAAGTYYIAINAGTISSLKVECVGTDNTIVNSISQSIELFTRGSIIDLGTVSVENGWTTEHTPQHVYEYGKGKAEAVAVDLGLPSGLKWSSVNLGATSPEEYGDYYAWGATVPWVEEYHVDPVTKGGSICDECRWNGEHSNYDYYNAPYQTVKDNPSYSNVQWSKYTGNDPQYSAAGASYIDLAKTVLDPMDDAACYQWGTEWHTPTREECIELAWNTYCEWVGDYNNTGVAGIVFYKAKRNEDKGMFHNGDRWAKCQSSDYFYLSVTEPSDFVPYDTSIKHIFLPASDGIGDFREWSNNRAQYTCSTLLKASSQWGGPYFSAWGPDLRNGFFYRNGNGHTVRPVRY